MSAPPDDESNAPHNPYSAPSTEEPFLRKPLPYRVWVKLSWLYPLLHVGAGFIMGLDTGSSDPAPDSLTARYGDMPFYSLGLVIGFPLSIASIFQAGKLRRAMQHGLIGLGVNIALLLIFGFIFWATQT